MTAGSTPATRRFSGWASAAPLGLRLGELIARAAAREGAAGAREDLLEEMTDLAARWGRAVAAGDAARFARRLAWDGLPQPPDLVPSLAAAAAAPHDAPWITFLKTASPELARAGPGDAAGALAAVARRRLAAAVGYGWGAVSGAVRDGLESWLVSRLSWLLSAPAPWGSAVNAEEWLASWPGLARAAAELVLAWEHAASEFLERLRHDLPELRRLDPRVGEPGTIDRCTAGLSDPHDGGRSVIRVGWRGGAVLYYKPRPLEPEAHLGAVLEALRERGIPAPRQPKALLREGYGWVVEATRAELTTAEDAEGWFEGAGVLAAVAWALGLSDLHRENVVAADSGPVVVDAETLLQPRTVFDGEAHQGEPGILGTGFVTFPCPTADGGIAEEGAILGGLEPGASSLPTFRGAVVDPGRHWGDLARGARGALTELPQVLAAWRRGELPCGRPHWLRTRWLPRPSEAYAAVLRLAMTRRQFRRGWDVGLLAEALLRPVVAASRERPPWWPLVAEERDALERLDVPRLTVPAAPRRPEHTGLIVVSGLDRVERRIRSLEHGGAAEEAEALAAAVRSAGGPAAAVDLLRAAARHIARRLVESGGRGAVGPWLARGPLGVALALAEWGALEDDAPARARAAELFRSAALSLRRDAGPAAPVGLCTGSGGAVYALAAGAALLADPELADHARRVARAAIAAMGGPVPVADVEGGVAGLALALAGASRGPEGAVFRPLLARAASALLGLRERAGCWPGPEGDPFPGFAHGQSGIAAALLEAHAVLEDPELLEAAVEALRSEPDAGRWRVPATAADGHGVPLEAVAWCNGPAGALLARAMAHGRVRAPWLTAQLEAALERTRRSRLQGPAHLCCGTLGRNEILREVGKRLHREDLVSEATWRTVMVVRRAGWAARPPEMEPGLFFGLAGILHHLIRCLHPEVPGSVLSAALPGGTP